MSWGRVPQGAIRVSHLIEKYKCGQISHKNKNYRIKTSIESRGDINVNWGVGFD